MKALQIIIVGIAIFLASAAQAQVSLNVHLGSPPAWGPTGYNDAQYYYLPDVESYYDVNSSMFIYNNNGRWVHRRSLPYRYRNYDLYNGYKVVMSDYRGNTPYTNYSQHRMQYNKGYRGPEQRTIGTNPRYRNQGTNDHNYGRSNRMNRNRNNNNNNNSNMQDNNHDRNGNRK